MCHCFDVVWIFKFNSRRIICSNTFYCRMHFWTFFFDVINVANNDAQSKKCQKRFVNSKTIKIIAIFYNSIFSVSVVLFSRQKKRRSKRILTKKISRFLFFEFVFDFCLKKTTITSTKKANLIFFLYNNDHTQI